MVDEIANTRMAKRQRMRWSPEVRIALPQCALPS
jgi:hypothetical protein